MLPGAAGGALRPESREDFIAGDEFDPAAFQIVVAAIQRFPRKGDFVEEIGYDVLHQFVTPASGISRHLFKLRLDFGGKVDFHSCGSFSENTLLRLLFCGYSGRFPVMAFFVPNVFVSPEP